VCSLQVAACIDSLPAALLRHPRYKIHFGDVKKKKRTCIRGEVFSTLVCSTCVDFVGASYMSRLQLNVWIG
jgi:hypothetical protein